MMISRPAMRIYSLVMLLACILTFGCPAKPQKESSAKIAVIIQAESNPFFVEIEKGMRESAQEHNAKLVVISDVKYQAKMAENLCLKLLKTGLEALIIVPESRDRSVEFTIPLIQEANRQKAHVVLLHSGVDDDLLKAHNASTEALVMSDKMTGAKLAAGFIAKKLDGRGRVLIMEGGGYPNQTEKGRRDGFLEVMKSYPKINILYAPPGLWDRDYAFKSAVEAFKKYPKIDAIYVFSEPMAYGVLDAVDYTKIKKPIIVAFDGTESGKKMIEKGSFDAIVDQKPYEMGRMATEYALRLIKGEKIPSPGLTHTELITIESVTRPFKK